MLTWWTCTRPSALLPLPEPTDAVKNPNSALQQVAEDWIESYKDESGPAMAELVNFVLRVRSFPSASPVDGVRRGESFPRAVS